MRNGIVTTVAGWVASDPREIVEGGSVWTSFRLGVTPRRRDAITGGWSDGRTEWVTVKAWRELARNVAESVSKGNPVVVHGRLEVDEWKDAEGGIRRDLALHASHVGHDLLHGRTTFVRRVHVSPTEDETAATAGRAGDGSAPDPWASDDLTDAPAGTEGAQEVTEAPAVVG